MPPTIDITNIPEPFPVSGPRPAMPRVKILGTITELKGRQLIEENGRHGGLEPQTSTVSSETTDTENIEFPSKTNRFE